MSVVSSAGLALSKGLLHRAAVQYLQEASHGPSPPVGLGDVARTGGGFEPVDESGDGVVLPPRNIAPARRIAPTTALCPLCMCVPSRREIALLNRVQMLARLL